MQRDLSKIGRDFLEETLEPIRKEHNKSVFDRTVRNNFEQEVHCWRMENMTPMCIVVAVQLPTGAIEVITNFTEVDTKIDYYLNAYDKEFKLKNNPSVQIVSFMIV